MSEFIEGMANALREELLPSVIRMMSLSHWGMFDARVVPYRLFPLVWANGCDTEFYA